MKNSLQFNGRNYDLSPIDISIPLRFNGAQPNAYGVEPATSKPCEYGSLVGDTRRGGSVNFEQYTFIPHCNGTHTECIGHITQERISVRDCLKEVFMPAVLITVEPSKEQDDLVITSDAIAMAIKSEPGAIATGAFLPNRGSGERPPATGTRTALIVRTLPNDDNKLTRAYGAQSVPAYFTPDAMGFIVESGFKHLLVDLPSIDRLFDGGKLLNHRIFWNVEPGSFEVNDNSRINATITELIYVPNDVKDGEYLLNLQIAPFESDCAPSRPILLRSEPPA